jgi:hypothetical protein
LVQDDQALYIVGDTLANDDAWPGSYDGSEFKALRDKTMAGRSREKVTRSAVGSP